jgi:heat shock protein HtpX
MKTSYRIIEENLIRTYLLMGVFVGIIFALGYLASIFYENVSIFYIFALIGILVNFFSYFWGDKIITSITGAKEVSRNELPEVYNILENLSISIGLPKTPKLYLIESNVMNAFATGRNYYNSLVAVTSGLVKNLSKEEIEGVIAHELSHIKNRDTTVMMISTVLSGIIAIIADLFLRMGIHNNKESKNNFILLAIGFLFVLLAPIFAQLIHLAISRKREYMADATGALITRNPEGLASALEKISKQSQSLDVSPATASLFIVNPFKNKKDLIGWLGNLFSTHPPVEERIRLLRNMVL